MIHQTGEASAKERPVKILLLGPPEIFINGKPVLVKRRLNRALLFYLAAQRQPVSRDELCALFWPEEDEDTARKNLRESLSRIRTGLGIHDLLITSGEQVSLNRELVKVDFLEMDGLISPLMSSSEMNNSAILPDWMVIQLKAGMSLSRTNRFMQGLYLPGAKAFENWVEITNLSINFARLKVYDRFIDHFISIGNLEEAIIWLGRVTELNPMDENNNYLTLICLRDTGRTQELINYVGYLENLYEQQQETFPERFAELKRTAVENKKNPVVPGSAWPESERGEPPFIGRENELENLNRVLRKRGILLLEGEAGIGKTRLMKQFFEQQPYTPRLFYVSGHPLATRVMFYPIILAARNQILNAEWKQLNEQDRFLLSGFYHTTLQDPEGPGVPRDESEWLPVLEDVFLAFMHLLEISAAHRPLLFILDDAQLLDLASVSIVSFLLDHGFFDKYGLLVVVASPEVVNLSLNLMLQKVNRERKLEKIQLPPFTEQEVNRFIQLTVGRVPDNEAVDLMRILSGGNPYFLTECLRSAKWRVQHNKVQLRPEDCSIPDSVSAMVRDKVNGLEADSVTLVNAAAILGRKFCPDVLEEMTGFGSEKAAVCLDELVSEGFIKVNPYIRPLGGYEFLHDVEREVIYGRITPARRRELHYKAARALVKRRKGIPRFSFALARHYEISLQQNESLEAWLEAGRYARTQNLLEETHQAYGNALQLIRRIPAHFDEKKILMIINEWGNFAHDRDDQETGKFIYQTCVEIGNEINSLLLIGAGHSGLGRVADFEYDYEGAMDSFQRALFYLSPEEHATERVKALSRLGVMQFGMDNYLKASSLLEEARSLDSGGKDHDSLENRVNILTYLCFLDIFMGDPLKAGENAAELARLSILVKRKSARVQAHGLLAMSQYFNSEVKQALQTNQEFMGLAENLQVRFWWSLLDNVASMAHLYTGNLDQSWEAADRAEQREKNFQLEKLYMQAIKVKGDIYRSLEDHPRANEYYEILTHSGIKSYQTISCQQGISSILYKEGKIEEAVHILDNTIKESAVKGMAGLELNARWGRLLQVRKDISVEAFEREGNEIHAEMTRRGMLDARIYEFLIPALGAEMRAELDEALRIYNEMEDYLAGVGNIWEEFKALKKIITLCQATGQDSRAAKARVNELLTDLGKNATHPAIKGSFIKFRNKWKRYVNDVSTQKVYKHKHI